MMMLRPSSDGAVLLAVHVQPRASRNRVCGIHGNSLKIAITTAPVDGKANRAAIALLASSLGLAKRQVELQSGPTSRRKVFRISGVSLQEVRRSISSILNS